MVRQTLERMTLEEKAALCSGRDFWTTKPIERLNVPSIWLSDGPHGLRKAPNSADIGLGNSHPATCFPAAAALSSSWDTDLVRRVGEALGREAQAVGVDIVLGPAMNLKRSPLGGRNFEYFSEDPLLTGELAAALTQGIQSQGVGASAKHFVCNNQEFERMTMSSEVDERTLREIYLRAFEIVVRKAQPWTIMASYNRVNGVYASENRYLLHEIVKQEWGLEGIVVSDWGAVNDRVEGIKAGMHLEMPGNGGLTDGQIVEAVRSGELEEERLDEIAAGLLQIIFRAAASRRPETTFDQGAHHELAGLAAAESIVLLKNEGDLLPLEVPGVRRVAIIGRFSKEPRYQGAGSSQVVPTQIDNVWDSIQERGQGIEFTYAEGHAAEEAARNADVAVVFVGLPPSYESEGFDRKSMDLPPSHNALVEAVAAVQSNVVVVLSNGSVVSMPWVSKVRAIVETWLAGQAGGGAIADVLMGAVNPSGKLAETFPVRLPDNPSYLNFPGEAGKVRYGEGLFVGYRYYDAKEVEPLFAFGHGLAYTTFEYRDLKVEDTETLQVELVVKNTGKRAGREIVQLYVSDSEARLPRPPKELKAFVKVDLEAGEEKTVHFELDRRAFAFYDPLVGAWVTEGGAFELLAGASSRDIRLRTAISREATDVTQPKFDRYTLVKLWMSRPEAREKLQPLLAEMISAFSSESEGMAAILADMPIVKMVSFSQGQFSLEMLDHLIAEVNAGR